MILDNKLITLCDIICKQFDNEYFVFIYDSCKVIINCINRGKYSILSLEIDKKELTDYPESPSIYVLDVAPASFMLETDAELILESYTKYSDGLHETYLKSTTFLSEVMRMDNYIRYPFNDFNYTMARLVQKIPDETQKLEFRYKKYNGTYSVPSLKKLIFGDNIKSIWFMMIGTDLPLYMNYNTHFDGLNVKVYGVLAPLISVVSDDWIRLI